MVLDPGVAANLAAHDLSGIFAFGEKVILLRHNPDADHIVLQRDVPKPTAPLDIGHRGVALVEARVAFRDAKVSPDRQLVELRIRHPPAFARRRHLLPPRAVDRHRREKRPRFPILLHSLDTDHAPSVILEHPLHRRLFAHVRALGPRVVEQHEIKVGTLHLPRHGAWVIVVLEEIERLRLAAVRRHKLHAVFLRVSEALHLRHEAEPVQREPAKRHQGLADVITREFFLFEDQHTSPLLREQRARGAPGGAAADDDGVVVCGMDRAIHTRANEFVCSPFTDAGLRRSARARGRRRRAAHCCARKAYGCRRVQSARPSPSPARVSKSRAARCDSGFRGG